MEYPLVDLVLAPSLAIGYAPFTLPDDVDGVKFQIEVSSFGILFVGRNLDEL